MSRPKKRAARRRWRERRRAERECRLVWAPSLPPSRPDLSTGQAPCRHTWGEPEITSFPCGIRAETRVCETCQGLADVCEGCGVYHLVYKGRGGEYSMPSWVSGSWLKEHRCAGENFGDIRIPFVRIPPDYEPQRMTCRDATSWCGSVEGTDPGDRALTLC